jgi:asparagine synthase (glutamine-hydrolysing)
MCGITLYASQENTQKTQYNFYGMKCSHRGPDSTETKQIIQGETNIFMVFHRLAINGLDKESNQPMCLSSYPHITLICNGEIYNCRELAEQYDCQLQTGSDCEILIHLYHRFPVCDWIHQLDGVFSFAIIDTEKHHITLGHDRIGIRPLYYTKGKNSLCASSEMKCLSGLDGEIQLFPPGTFSIYNYKVNTIVYSKYFNIQDYLKHYSIESSHSVLCKMIEHSLFQAVKKRMLSDRPIGCFLSGGIDSSIIAYLMCKILGNNNVNTFSIGLPGSPDLESAKQVADFLQTNHTEVIVSENDLIEAIDPTIYHLESYDTTTIRASVPMFVLSQYINQNTDIVVMLSGEGADEASGSYLYFHNAPNSNEFQKECLRLIQDVQHFDVLRCDKTTAAHGLEVRVPFFDKDFLDMYLSIHPDHKMPMKGYEKYLLRKTFEPYLPKEIVWRKKDGFSDGISSHQKPWYSIIEDYAKQVIPGPLVVNNTYEETLFKDIFEKYYPGRGWIVPYIWLPKWSGDQTNPSGRLLMNT